MDYRQSGVDIDAGNETVRRIKVMARRTFTPDVLSDIGSFGGLFALRTDTFREPVLVSSADGVGTKLKVAFMAGRHDTIGTDLVNHCVNDILVQGARPLFFLDYLATGRLRPDVAEQVVAGVATGCRANGCALLGGETAEMPGFYGDGEYDIAGFIVGIVERAHILDGHSIVPDDILIGLPSSGLHTNGYSLARRVLFEHCGFTVESPVPGSDQTLGDSLLAVHRSYLAAVRRLLDDGLVKGMAHITGGGMTENLPRILPDGCGALLRPDTWTIPSIFGLIEREGGLKRPEMFRVFNMGIGLVIVCAAAASARVLEALHEAGESRAAVIGEVIRGEHGVTYR